jgi:hypothetical protein
MRLSRPLLVLIALSALMLMPSRALAVTNSQVVADCNAHGRLVQHYSNARLRAALATLPADVAEYTNCADVIRKQLLAQVSGAKSSGPGSGTGGSGGSFLPTWVIVLLVILILGGAGATLAARRQGGESAG